ncbi:YkgJ family cysteine cluster protein [Lysobacter fragariae]
MPHPCLTCGACCASFRVSLHWSETEPTLQGITPAELTERIDAHQVAMRGTWAKQPRCIALQGDVGVHAHCRIYEQRPSPCRQVEASWEHGAPDRHCDRARTLHGLRALTPEDWR